MTQREGARNALVTGGRGFIGSRVITRLAAAGYRVACVDRRDGGSVAKALSDLAPWTSPDDLVVHCAGPPTVGAVTRDPDADFHSSVLGTVDLLAQMAAHAPSARLVFCSSAAVYGNSRASSQAETDRPWPVSAYGTHKLVCELLIQQFCRDQNLRGAIVRLFSVYGEGMKKQLLWDACQKFSRGDPVFHGTGDEERDFIHVDDAVEVLLLAARKSSQECPVVNGGTGVATTVRGVITRLSESLHSNVAPSFNGVPSARDPERLCADLSLLKSWGFSSRVPWEDGVERYCHWFVQNAS